MFSFLGRVLRARVERRAEVADLVRSRAVSMVAFKGVLVVDGCDCCCSCGNDEGYCFASVVYNNSMALQCVKQHEADFDIT